MHQPHPTWIEIDLSAISSNCTRIIRDTGTPLMAIVKGDAYGHGALQVSRAALEGGASWLGAARFGEARAPRQSGIRLPFASRLDGGLRCKLYNATGGIYRC